MDFHRIDKLKWITPQNVIKVAHYLIKYQCRLFKTQPSPASQELAIKPLKEMLESYQSPLPKNKLFSFQERMDVELKELLRLTKILTDRLCPEDRNSLCKRMTGMAKNG